MLLLPLLPLAAVAASPPVFPDLSTPPAGMVKDGAADVALIMAVEDYAALPDIHGARANASDWDAYLRARGVATVKLLLDQEVTPARVFEVGLPSILAQRKAGGRVWVVFIGHGAPGPDDRGALVGWAAQQDPLSLRTDAISQTQLLDAIGPDVPVTMVVDACFSGTAAGGELAPGAMPVRPVDTSVDALTTLMVAAKGAEYAGPLPGLDRPAFSWLVLGALRGWGDEDQDGNVAADEAVSWSRRILANAVNGRLQTPQVIGQARAVLARASEQLPVDLVALVRQSAGAGASVAAPFPSFSDLKLDVSAQLREQACVDEAKSIAAAARAKLLDAEVARVTAEATASWATLEQQATACLKVTDANTRETCAQTLETFVTRASSLTASLPADTETATTACGARTVAFAAETKPVKLAAVTAARGLTAKLRVAPSSPTSAVPSATSASTAPGRDWTSPSLGLMKWIPAGRFVMGSPEQEKGRSDDEVQHTVVLTKGFLLMEQEVTQRQWKAVMGENPSKYTSCGSRCPVEQVSWLDAVAFANALSKKEGLDPVYTIDGKSVRANSGATGYRLPTESEWEYAARAGGDAKYAGSDDINSVGWVSSNSELTTHPGCGKARNGYGLCDMTGNVWEWVWDWYGEYPTGGGADPSGPEDGSRRVYRGGGWLYSPPGARVANRDSRPPTFHYSDLGLRLARSVP